jgi:hypothetical protein
VVTGEKLVLAARVQNGENHQVRIREQPLFCAGAGGFGRARELSEMLVLGQSVKVIQTNACEARDFVLGEELLARFDSYHQPRLKSDSMQASA